MIVYTDTVTPGLLTMLRGAHDDGLPLLHAHCNDDSTVCIVRRSDGSDLSPTERREVRALLAAHNVEPL